MITNDNRKQSPRTEKGFQPGSASREPRGLPRAVRAIVNSWIVGSLLGLALAATLIALNVGKLYDLIEGAGDKITPVALLCAGCATLCGGLWAAASVMLLHKQE